MISTLDFRSIFKSSRDARDSFPRLAGGKGCVCVCACVVGAGAGGWVVRCLHVN